MENKILDENFDPGNYRRGQERITIAQINNIKIYVNAKIRDVKTGRGTLIVMGVFLVLASTFNIFINNEEITITDTGVALFKALVYIACAIGISTNPRFSLIFGLFFFFLIQVYYAFIDVNMIFTSLIVKIPIVYFLFNGIIASIKLVEKSGELLLIGVPASEIELIKKLKEVPRT